MAPRATIPVENARRSPRHVVVARQHRGEPGEISKGGVSGDNQDASRRNLKNVVRQGRPKHSHRDLRDDGFFARHQAHICREV